MRFLWTLLCIFLFCPILDAQSTFKYVPAPPDNPLKGLVPYAQPAPNRFPHSMEFFYLPLSSLMSGQEKFNWQPLEKSLDAISERGHQAVFRIWMEYPGHEDGIPEFLEEQGLKVIRWQNTNTQPFPEKPVRTPDYEDPKLRAALTSFISELGRRYDGDPRIGYITAGLLGTWGEWHTYPRTELMASKQVQNEVMEAYQQAFQKTPVLLRYPAGENDWAHAPNADRRFGYHDDSFAWATLDTGRPQDNWFFVPALKSAGPAAIEKWKSFPIGGEIRPEVWGTIFDDTPSHANAQDFSDCVHQTHVTWLMDTGMFREKASPERMRNAIRQVQKMGYEFHIQSVEYEPLESDQVRLKIRIKNTGIAPFYHQWQVQLAPVRAGEVLNPLPNDWTVKDLLPGQDAREWQIVLEPREQHLAEGGFALRIANPLPNGRPLRFANEYPANSPQGWWLLP